MLIRINKGLDIPVAGAPVQAIDKAGPIETIALIGQDFPGLKPKLCVEQGQRVKLGGLLFTDKLSGVSHTSPGCGVISQIHRGHRNSLDSITITLDGNDEEIFPCFSKQDLNNLDPGSIRQHLQDSGLWSALRSRPFNAPPAIHSQPHALFVTAMDSNVLAADPAVIIANYQQEFIDGLTIMSRMAEVPIFTCKAPEAAIPVPEIKRLNVVEFSGPHPAGLVGTHIHNLFPARYDRPVWHINYQDVIAIGKLFTTGRLWVERIVSLAGPQVQRPRLIQTRIGANIGDLVNDELKPGNNCIVSGPLLSGLRVQDVHSALGRYHLQISVIASGNRGKGDHFSINSLLPTFQRKHRRYHFSDATHGKQRPLFPLGNFEKIFPLDIFPTALLKALLIEDLEMAQSLGCLELDEEDLALCSFVCCSKQDYGAALRQCLTRIQAEI
jgi:Na+-transporting NADH:ubiquinone oxidoreductase subunit A